MIKSKILIKPILHRNFIFLPTRNYEIYSTNVASRNKGNSNMIFSRRSEIYYGLQSNINCSQRCLSTESFTNFQTKLFTYLSQHPATEVLKNYVVAVHDITGLPWWTSVILCTFILRTFITLPLAVYQARILAKIENISLLEMPEVAEEVRKKTAMKVKEMGWPPPKAQLFYKINMKQRWNELIIRDNCHPFKATATVWFQLPTWIFFSSALRNMAYMLPFKTAESQIIYMNLAVGGFLWVPNLTQPDGSLILPFLLGFSNLAIIEIQAMMRLRKPSKFQRYITNFFRCFSIALIPISATVPSVLCLYWTSSSILGLCQNLLLMSNRVKKFCGVADTPTTLDHPYQQLAYEIKQKCIAPVISIKRKS